MFARIIAALVAVMVLTSGHAPVPAPMDMEAWLSESVAESGLVIPENVVFVISDVDNCGSMLSPDLTGGGCTIWLSDGTVAVLVSPTAIQNGTGTHILFHELGHALEDLGECDAEAYAHVFSDPDLWSYPECKA